MGFFQDQYKNLNLRLKEQEGRPGLRVCQIGAFWATLAHFTSSEDPALIVMPTGSGKTAVMMVLAFGLEASRVLVIAPEVILRDQTYEKFRTLDDLIKAKALPPDIKKPKVHKQEGRITSPAMWEALRKYDVVVATPHTTSRGYHEEIAKPPKRLFDVVFFDEAHHARAPSWDLLLKDLSESKCILLTATPFRLDKRRLPGRIVYYYPIGKALDAGIYRLIQYHPVKASSTQNRNLLLVEEAKKLLTFEKNQSHRTKLLIRTDRVHKSKPLIKLYRSQGIIVDEVNYKKTLDENNAVLNDIKQDKLDGVVCVGMLGEGLDIPELKIAVLHDPPKSFPFTVQFIGRVSRPTHGQVGPAHVVANPDQVKAREAGEPLRRLYRRDVGWHKLVPDLVEEVVGPLLRQDQALLPGPTQDGFNAKDIAPFFSARLYEVAQGDLDFHAKPDLGDQINVFAIPQFHENFMGLITESIASPPWGTRLDLESIVYDLHVYYYHKPSRTLFESTTSDVIATKIRSKIVTGELRRLGGEELIKVMQSRKSMDYLMVGLANALGPCAALPTYKILMGKEVQGAVGPTEGRVFVPGHALAKISEEETRGIGNFQGRVWAIKRAPLTDFIDWCERVGDELVRNRSATLLRDFPFLLNPRRVKNFPDTPVEILFAPLHVNYSFTLVQSELVSNSVALNSPRFEIKNLTDRRKRLQVDFYPNADSDGIPLTYDLERNQWNVNKNATYKVQVETGSETEPLPLQDFLSESEYCPYIYLSNGGLIINGQLHQSSFTYSELPDECFLKGIDWSGCDILVEFEDPAKDKYLQRGKKTVHDWLEEKLKKETGDDAIILKDHGTGEIADFIVVDPSTKRIVFYHCKGCPRTRTGGANIGSSIDHVQDVMEQVLRSIAWIKTGTLLTEIVGRGTGAIPRPASKFVKGIKSSATKLNKSFLPTTWSYEVVIVQPGLDCKKAVRQTNTNILLLNCYEWLKHGIGANLLIMGYYP